VSQDHDHDELLDNAPDGIVTDTTHAAQTGVLATLTLAEVERRVTVLAPPAMTADEVAYWLDLSAVLVARAREVRRAVEAAALAWIEANGPLDVGGIRYTAGTATAVRCLDACRCAELVLTAVGGDVTTLVAYLRSDPWKYGSVRQLLGEEAFATVFRSEHRAKLIEGHPPQRQLVRTDRRFARRKEARP